MKAIYTYTIKVNMAGHPVCQDCVDVAVFPAGDRSFLGCFASNNLCLADYPTNYNNNEVRAATAYAGGGTNWIRESVWTPYGNKVLAAQYAVTQADSKIMILDTTKTPIGTTGIIPLTAYTTVQSGYIWGPEGIGVWPHFDRDGDKISDLIEATNADVLFIDLQTGEMRFFNPTVPDVDPSRAYGTYDNGWLWNSIRLPNEGIGYRHFIGPASELGKDNWGILKMIQLIEAVGREWNQSHKEGPRISIGDISPQYGGGGLGHASHQNGKDVDVRYILNNGTEGPMDFCNPPTCLATAQTAYDQSLAQELVNLFIKFGANQIFVDQLSGINGTGVTQQDGSCGTYNPQTTKCTLREHSHHFHVRIP